MRKIRLNSNSIENSGLTHQSWEATQGYCNSTSGSIINAILRREHDYSIYADVIERLDSHMEIIQRTTVLYRQMDWISFCSYKPFGLDPKMTFEEIQKKVVGKKFRDRGFMSCATSPEGMHYEGTDFIITCPPGTRAIWTGNDKEKEVILDRNQEFLITAIYKEDPNDPWSQTTVEMTRVGSVNSSRGVIMRKFSMNSGRSSEPDDVSSSRRRRTLGRKLNSSIGYDFPQKNEFTKYLHELADRSLMWVEGNYPVQIIEKEFPGYDSRYCSESMYPDLQSLRDRAEDAIVQYLMANLLYNFDEVAEADSEDYFFEG